MFSVRPSRPSKQTGFVFFENNIPQKCLKLAMKYKGIVSGIKTSKMSAKICKITFPDHGANS
jgi:hypothetical protein